MEFFIIPERIKIVFSVDSKLLKLLQQIVDQQNDRAAAKALTADVKGAAGDLSASIPPSSTKP